jgi:3-deoxy-manno-octulosonate cytidylyltransferase (CMP-KDO synthetase)
MIEHVYRRVAMCDSLDSVVVATCDNEIHQAVTDFGGRAVMTSPNHERASDRVAEAAQQLEADVIVMVQGDEPMTTPTMVSQAIQPFIDDADVGCVNLMSRIPQEDEYRDPNTIKVVADLSGNALFMSREPIPTARQSSFEKIEVFKQVCVIPFRRDRLDLYSQLAPTPLEIAESIDMLRFLEHGYDVRMVLVESDSHAVDTPEDLRAVEERLLRDPLTSTYVT